MFHQVGGLFHVVNLLTLNLLDLLPNRIQVFWLLVVALVAMAAHATFLTEQVLAIVDGLPLHIAAGEHHVGRVAGLAAGLRVLLGKKRPQPVFVVAVRLLHTRRRAAVALVARGAAKSFRIVDLQFSSGMTHKRRCILVGLLLTFERHRRRGDLQRLARSHVAGFAAVHDVRLGHIDLHDLRIPVCGFLFQAIDLRRRELDHVVGDVLIHLGLGVRYRLQHVAQFKAQPRALVANFVVGFFQLLECVLLFASVRELDGRLLFLVGVQIFFFTGLRRPTFGGLDFVGQCVDVRAAVGKHGLHGQQPCAGVIEFSAGLFRLSFGVLIRLVVGLLERSVIRILFDILF